MAFYFARKAVLRFQMGKLSTKAIKWQEMAKFGVTEALEQHP